MAAVTVSPVGLVALRTEGRWWRRGTAHRIAELQLVPFGRSAGEPVYVARVLTGCGERIEAAELERQSTDHQGCRRRGCR